MNNKYYTVCGIVEINGKIMLVRHTYGTAKGRILLPGGYVKESELPTLAAEREIFEETSVKSRARSVMSIQFKPEQWCVCFVMEYISGEPRSDGAENDEVVLLTPQEAVNREDITNLSREILTAYINGYAELNKSGYIAKSSTADDYAIFGV